MKKIFDNVLATASTILIFAACNQAAKNDNTAKDSVSTETRAVSIFEGQTDYSQNGKSFKSYIAYNQSDSVKQPVVLVVPEWWGVNDYTKSRVKQLAELGYLAMAVDMYGDGKVVDNPNDAQKLAIPFYKEPQMAKENFEAALAKVKSLPQADTSKIAAIGYCFGGGMVLNMARFGEPLKGVVSFHGDLKGYGLTAKKGQSHPAVLVCHGAADSMSPPEDTVNFKKEMNTAGINYKFVAYPGAKHAFTNPAATTVGQKYKLDIAYNEAADKASWQEMKDFLNKVFQ